MTVLGGRSAEAALAAVDNKYDRVAEHHAGTPWADTAKHCRKFVTYQVTPAFPPRGGGTYKPAPTPPAL